MRGGGESQNGFLVKYDSEGIEQWSDQIGAPEYDGCADLGGGCSIVPQESGNGVAVDTLDNIYVTGFTGGGLGDNTNAGGNDLFLIKYNDDGSREWTQQIGTSANEYGTAVATDSSNNIYITGFTGGDLDGSNAGSNDLFVVKYDSAGNRKWTEQLGTSLEDYAVGIATDSSGNVYVTGYTEGALDGSNAGAQDIFVVKYDSAGVKQWTKQLGTSSSDDARGIATDSSGNVYVTGSTLGALEGTNAGVRDLFVMKLK